MSDEQHDSFPLGKPVNRPAPKPEWIPNPARGTGWFKHMHTGEEKYVEPQKPELKLEECDEYDGTFPWCGGEDNE